MIHCFQILRKDELSPYNEDRSDEYNTTKMCILPYLFHSMSYMGMRFSLLILINFTLI